MRRAIFVAVAIAFMYSFPFRASAEVEYIIGAKVWNASWVPYVKDVGKELTFSGWEYLETGSGIMYGPSIAIMPGERVSISVSYLYGILESNFSAEFIDAQYEYHYNGSVKTTRHDLDTAVSYVLNPSLKIFVGFKYQPAELEMHNRGGAFDLSNPGNGAFIDESVTTMRQYNYAPGAGIGLSFIIMDYLAFTANLSVIYSWGKMEVDNGPSYYYYHDGAVPTPWTIPSVNAEQNFSLDVQGVGANIEPAFVILFGDNVIASVGFRFQYVRMKVEVPEPFGDVSGLDDYLYGTYFAVLYKI